MSQSEVQFRCPRDRTMFGILYKTQVAPIPGAPATPPDYLAFSCQKCRQNLAKRGMIVGRVIHRFRMDGSLIGTDHEPARG